VTDQDTIVAEVDPALREQVVETLLDLLPKVLKREVPGVSEDTTLMDALGISSTTGLELILELEDRLEREISVEDLDRAHFETVGSLAGYVAGNLLPED
jgi:acyl carrier protein